MRVSFLALIAMAAITFLASSGSAMAMPLVLQEAGPTSAKTSDGVMQGKSKWSIDNEHTSMVCAVSHFGLSFIYGRFNDCSGTIEMDLEDPGSATFRFEVDPVSIDTNDATRDLHLRGPDCLDTQLFDKIVFESVDVQIEDLQDAGQTKRTFQVAGNLSMHGETRRIKIPVQLLAMGNGPDSKIRCGFMSRFVVSRSEFGIDAMADTVGDSVAITFCFQAVRQDEEPKEDKSPFRFEEKEEERSKQDIDAEIQSERARLEELFSPKSGRDDEVAPDSDTNESAGEEIK